MNWLSGVQLEIVWAEIKTKSRRSNQTGYLFNWVGHMPQCPITLWFYLPDIPVCAYVADEIQADEIQIARAILK